AVGVGQHLADIEQLQRATGTVLGVGHLQDALEVERHDGDAIERRLPDLLPVDFWIGGLCPAETRARQSGDASGGRAEEFSSVHLALLTALLAVVGRVLLRQREGDRADRRVRIELSLAAAASAAATAATGRGNQDEVLPP